MYLAFVYYIPEDAHKVGQNMLEFTVDIISIYLCASVVTIIVYI
jgi:hypothetical protein